jgi:hypothetical protein
MVLHPSRGIADRFFADTGINHNEKRFMQTVCFGQFFAASMTKNGKFTGGNIETGLAGRYE